MIGTLKLRDFTAFEKLDLGCSPGINILVGENGTGKTHILKLVYAACELSNSEDDNFLGLLPSIFKPNRASGLIRKGSKKNSSVAFYESDKNIGVEYSLTGMGGVEGDKPTALFTTADSSAVERWQKNKQRAVYIPVKEMLSNAPGFRSLYSAREIAFEKVYADIIDKALLPPLKNGGTADFSSILEMLQKALGGEIGQSDENFYLDGPEYKLEFMLLAEGLRKLGLLWLLVRNGSLARGSVLCWDEPEANLNPRLMKTVVEILLRLQRLGVQIFLATHSYVLLKEFDLQSQSSDKIRFHALYHDAKSRSVQVDSTDDYLQINPNAIADTFADLYDRDLNRALGETT